MKRRSFIAGMTAGPLLAAPALAQGKRELKMATSWPKDLPGLDTSAQRFARLVTESSDGRLTVQHFPADTLVKAFEVFDAVSAGVADMYHSAEYYWEGKSAGFNFFAAVPFGLTADELNSWLLFAGGQELWDELSAPHGIKPLLATNTGVQMGGWFNKEVKSLADFRGLRYRMPGLGGEVLRRLGATVVNLPGGEIVPALRSGALDASEWVGPWNDMAIGLHEVASYYYYPGFHEPGTGIAVGINKGIWDTFGPSDQRLIKNAAAAELTFSLAEFNVQNTAALQRIRSDGKVKVVKFDDELLRGLAKMSAEVVAEAARSEPLVSKIYDSYAAFRRSAMEWSELSERGYLNARRL